MTKQELARKIIEREYIFPKSFTNLKYTDYGLLFYNRENDESHDSNHAVITKYNISDCDAIIKDIKDFYLSENLSPRIYFNLIKGNLEDFQDALIKNDFTIEKYNNVFRVQESLEDCKINEPYTLDIKKIEKGESLDFIYKIWKINENRKGAADRVSKIVRTRINNPDYNMLVGYLNGESVCAAAVEYYNGVGMVDEVETAEKYRGNGYARQIIRFLIDYHYKYYKNNIIYLWAANDTADRIYREAGFKDLGFGFESWSAYIDL